MWTYLNPVRIVFGQGCLGTIHEHINGRSYALVTYPDAYFASLTEQLSEAVGSPVALINDVAPNPDYRLLAEQVDHFREAGTLPDVFVALGGGSVIDTAKVLAAAKGDFKAVEGFLETKSGADRLGSIPIIAVPTTAGTGSEVTCWGTVWDEAGGRKHSLALPSLYPEIAVIDPLLMAGKPRELTVSTGLDALSHALESLWNKNVNPISMSFAVRAAREILETLPRLVENLDDVELRTRMARAALFSGLAFSNTKTAIAHSLSYPITLRHGVPHGIACSFTLPMVLRSMDGSDGLCGAGLAEIFGADLPLGADRLARFLDGLGVSCDPTAHGISRDEWTGMLDSALAGERGQNFIGSAEALRKAMVIEGTGV